MNRCQNESILKTNSGFQHLKLLNGENETVPINYKQLNLNSVTLTRGKNSLRGVTILKSTFKSLTPLLPARPHALLYLPQGWEAQMWPRESQTPGWLVCFRSVVGGTKALQHHKGLLSRIACFKHTLPEDWGQQEKQKTDFPHSRGVHWQPRDTHYC